MVVFWNGIEGGRSSPPPHPTPLQKAPVSCPPSLMSRGSNAQQGGCQVKAARLVLSGCHRMISPSFTLSSQRKAS
jgi:hypothetical protein